MSGLSRQDIEAIRKRAEAATEAPWDDFDDNWDGSVYEYDALTESCVDIIAECKTTNKLADAAFISAAREDVPRLLAEVERLQSIIRSVYSLANEFDYYAIIDEIEEEVD
ncbi:hypothetical protein D7Z54_33780 [Salibacterium salarium]|uniref:Uncharacterized protein n=1 Tax=Salibacterium salarium TaxID=284579 RepID=A0A428MS68_9BACI|nr:hypothetical protein [Salibacterium salarium]RSL28949.1 hypothetical protein D7Z54_33780 [Salibacterium salarium]